MLYLGEWETTHIDWCTVAAAVHPGKMYSRPAHHILGTGLPAQHPNTQQYLKTLDSWCLPILILIFGKVLYTPIKICESYWIILARMKDLPEQW